LLAGIITWLQVVCARETDGHLFGAVEKEVRELHAVDEDEYHKRSDVRVLCHLSMCARALEMASFVRNLLVRANAMVSAIPSITSPKLHGHLEHVQTARVWNTK
jgi:hypothetical protein